MSKGIMYKMSGDDYDLKTRVDYIEKSISKTEIALNKRLEGMNEFRDALKDQAGHFVTNDQLRSEIKILNAKIDLLQRMMYGAAGAILVIEWILRS